jgi:hypothetical protein
VPRTWDPQIFRATLEILDERSVAFGTRDIYFLVPPGYDGGS